MDTKDKEAKVNFDEMIVYDFYSINLNLYEGKNGCIDKEGYVNTYDSFQHYDHGSCYHR
ncbi:hypothetical protein K7I13_05230 [Brucepastera parasyntrophica]|uniref:hypothetical protein n=1 Tax=Brucepastera parasyntrophica TaxID=2880008 RepID=UPI00210AC357|nr:hypothetical protein [Brucepastera parasyntrophica]ULQ60677.1 hypothetical protein K7I13_05230 [Brucepastera parasyntrophica]